MKRYLCMGLVFLLAVSLFAGCGGRLNVDRSTVYVQKKGTVLSADVIQYEDIELLLEGSLDDIVRGRSLELELDKLAMNIDGEELFKVTGNVVVGPLDGEVTSTVQKETAFFEMTEEEWLEIAYMIDDEYGGLLNYLSYLWW